MVEEATAEEQGEKESRSSFNPIFFTGFTRDVWDILNPTVRRLAQLCSLPEDWDTYGAAAVEEKVVHAAIGVLVRAINIGMPQPSVVPTVHGGVQLEWHFGGYDLEIAFEPSGNGLIYFGNDDFVEWEGDPSENLDLIESSITQMVERPRGTTARIHECPII